MFRQGSGTRSSVSGYSDSSNKSQKEETVKKVSSVSDNITIRLSKVGIIDRSPSEVELQIQGGRISQILEETIHKLKICLSLPHLLENNAFVLHRYLQHADVEFANSVFTKYASSGHTYQLRYFGMPLDNPSVAPEQSAINLTEGSVCKKEPLIDVEMTQAMEMLWKSRLLRERVLADFNVFADMKAIIFAESMEKLRKITEEKLSVTAREQRDHELKLCSAWKTNAAVDDDIRKITEQLHKQRRDVRDQLNTKEIIYQEYKNKIESVAAKYHIDVMKKIIESEKAMREDSQASAVRQTDLAVEAKTVTQQYESLLSQHLVYEKGLRNRRSKVEVQLAGWLAKYDADMGDRNTVFQELSQSYQEEKLDLHALQEKFDEQEVEYVVLMTEKAEEEQRIFEEKAFRFICNRCARRIQRYWRAYRQRKLERKKSKKAKGKPKKASADAGGGGQQPAQ